MCPKGPCLSVTLHMQALTAARFDDILAHVSFTRNGLGGVSGVSKVLAS